MKGLAIIMVVLVICVCVKNLSTLLLQVMKMQLHWIT